MKKTIFLAVLGIVSLPSAFAADVSRDPTLHQATSCTEVTNVVQDYLKNRWNWWYFNPMAREGDMVDAPAVPVVGEAAASADKWSSNVWWWSDFSVTNVQKEGVDEPEIIKTNGIYIYYLDQNRGILRVLDPKSQREMTSITLPKEYWNAQLLINKDKLMLVWTKSLPYVSAVIDSSYVYRNQQTIIAVYSITQMRPKLLQAFTFDWWLQDSRVVDNHLVLISSQSLTWGPVYRAYEDAAPSKIAGPVPVQNFSVSSQDILPRWTTLVPAVVKSPSWKTRLITRRRTQAVDCTQFMYQKANLEKTDGRWYADESLTTIVRLSLDNLTKAPEMKTILGNNAQVHVSKKSIYLTSSTYRRQPFICPAWAMCLPWRGEWQYTSIYGFDLAGLSYKYATVVGGTTRNQYSMDEHTNGMFRIVTSSWKDNKNSSNVYIVQNDWKVGGTLENIAPGEQFYWVRFMGDYLYLVTYRQIDPLFVIDTTVPTKPSIIGELKMPWYSTYLHSYGALKDGVQYLIGIWYDTSVTPEWREQQNGIKLDLYKVDYNKKDSKWQVAVTQAWSRVLWKAGSQTEALYNPRMFVFNPTTKELLLPIVLADTQKVQSCTIVYDINGKELRKDCYPYDQSVSTFAGVKWWTLWLDAPTESLSVDYKWRIKNPYPSDMVKPIMESNVVTTAMDSFVDPRWYSAMQPRVGNIGTQYYMIWNQFAHFFTKANQVGTFVDFK